MCGCSHRDGFISRANAAIGPNNKDEQAQLWKLEDAASTVSLQFTPNRSGGCNSPIDESSLISLKSGM